MQNIVTPKIDLLRDPQALAAIHAKCFDAAAGAAWDAQAFAALSDKKDCRAYGNENGFILLQGLPSAFEILTLAVRPEARRGGLASALLKTAFQLADGVPIWLEVAADNQPALALYRGCGFVETGRRKAYYKRAGQKRVDALLMQWTKEQG